MAYFFTLRLAAWLLPLSGDVVLDEAAVEPPEDVDEDSAAPFDLPLLELSRMWLLLALLLITRLAFMTGRTRTITTDDVRVRADPAGEPLDVVNTGDQVEEIGTTDNGWSEIEYGQGVAYVATRYTRASRR